MTALDASPSERRIAQHMEASDASRTAHHTMPTPHPDSAQRLPIAAPGPHHSARSIKKNQNRRMVVAPKLQAARTPLVASQESAARAENAREKSGTEHASCAKAMRSALELFFALKKACGSVSEAPVSLPALPAAVTAKAPCARLRRISEHRALRAPEGKVVPPLPRNADAAPFRCFVRRLRPRCRQ